MSPNPDIFGVRAPLGPGSPLNMFVSVLIISLSICGAKLSVKVECLNFADFIRVVLKLLNICISVNYYEKYQDKQLLDLFTFL